MADITETLARIVNTQADEIARLRKVNDGLIADSREQAAAIRTLIDQRGAVVDTGIGERLASFYLRSSLSSWQIAEKIGMGSMEIMPIMRGEVGPSPVVRQRIEALIDGEVDNGR